MKTENSAPAAKDPTVETDRITHEPGKSYDIIAKLELTRVSQGGERIPISAAIGSPYKTMGGFWRTPIRLKGFGEPTPEVYGVDSMHSLYLAIENIRQWLGSINRHGDNLVDAEGTEMTAEKYFKLL